MEKQVPKTYHAAPLPFQGQKRNFVTQYRAALKEFKEEHAIDTVVDLFGGSGLLSHVSKRDYPELRVIYNDFDNYHLRIQNVRATNALLTLIRAVLKDYPGDRKINEELRREVLRIIKQEEDSGCFVDYITLSSSLLFSLNYALNYEKLSSETLYNKVRKSDYNTDGYLGGLTIVRKDYRELFAQYRGQRNVLFVVDPPYLSTDVGSYSSGAYWKLKDYLNVLNVLSADNYVYFTSDKSSIIELFEWLEANYMLRNPFSRAKTNTVCQYTGRCGRYTDLMYYKNYKR